MSILRHAGVKIDAEQQRVVLNVHLGKDGCQCINGTLDVVIGGKVYDIKSASSYAFKEKFSSYESLKEQDTFGYIAQLYGYAKAANKEPGGFIVVDKSSGDIKIVEVPITWDLEQKAALRQIEDNVKILLSNAPFKRCFEDKEETFKKHLTGNRVLTSPCNYCPFKYECWQGLKYLPSASSVAYDKPMKYYTVFNENSVM